MQFKLSEVADAAGLPINTLQTWRRRGHVVLSSQRGDREPEADGLPAYVSIRTAMMIGVMKAIVDFSDEISVDKAASAALKFAYTGLSNGRAPLYKHGLTVMVIVGDEAKILNVSTKSHPFELITAMGDASVGAIIVLNPIVERLCKSLCIPIQ